HFWDVWHGGKPFERYHEVTPRFCSEFGFQSLPSPATLRSAVGHDDRDLTSPVMQHHQRHEAGNTIIAGALERLFRTPVDFDALCYLSQLAHGLALKCGVEHWRRNKPRCMGTLYWQLQDCWVVASWASVDYELRYKAAHYFARRFYAPLLGSVVDGDSALCLWATSDLTADVEGAYSLELWHVEGRCLRRLDGAFRLPAQATRRIAETAYNDLIDPTIARSDQLVRMVIDADGYRHENLHVSTAYKELNLRRPEITTTVTCGTDGFRVALTTDIPALFVELDSGRVRGVFSDNYFALFPGARVHIEFTPAGEADVSDLRRELRTRSLRDTY
ncbi:MAG: hypothetical protein JSV19_01865, partial [Phycisphaerales bacterium]